MPRRTLLALTALVLALHWLVLNGIPPAWEGPATPQGKVFSTRSIAPAAMPPAAAMVTSPTQPPKAQPPARSSAKPVRKTPAPEPAHNTPQTQEPPESPTQAMDTASPGPQDAALPAEPTTPPVPEPTTAAAPEPVAAASAPLAAEAALGAIPTAANSINPGIDITAPGEGAGQAASTMPVPVQLPPPQRIAFQVTGQVKKLDYQARAELLWQHDGARYEARQNISVFLMGSRTQRSTGAITVLGLQPERFSDRNRSERTAHFDYDKGRVTFSANAPQAAVGSGVQDRLSVTIQLASMIAAAPSRFVPGTRITLTTVGDQSADRWGFEVQPTQTLDVAGQSVPTIKLRRLPRREPDQQLELWLAPSLGYLPARIKLTQSNGDTVDLQATGSSAP